MKKYFFMAAFATALFATSCSDNEVPEIETPNDQKEMISLSVGMGEQVVKAPTRATTYNGFTSTTRIVMRLQSDNDETSKRRYTRTLARAAAGSNYSEVSQDGAYLRYWDDAFGRKANLSVFAVAIPNKDNDGLLPEDKLKGETAWTSTFNSGDNEIEWEVNSSLTADKLQSSTVMDNQDLVYSNNIQKNSPVGGRYVYDFDPSPGAYKPTTDQLEAGTAVFETDRMRFKYKNESDETSPGRFDKGHLVFNHALSRLTLTIKSGDGFDAGTKFNLYTTDNNGVQALVMPVEGKLDVQKGSWNVTNYGTITTQPGVQRPEGLVAYASYTTSMQMLPGYVFNQNDDTNVLKFRIDDNEYYITQKMIHSALQQNAPVNGLTADATSYTMEQGKNYTLTVTVNKTKVDNITAQVAAWEDVAGKAQTLYNSYVTLNLKATTGQVCDTFAIYRMKVQSETILTDGANDFSNKEWMGNYDERQEPTYDHVTDKWKTTWYFEDNKTFYHFRTVDKSTQVHETDSPTEDYFTITSGPVATNDPHWGAPLESSATNSYKTEGTNETAGYGANIYKAIGSTTGTIAIQEFHMLSEINVILKTANDESGVKLKDGENETVVTLYQYSKDAKVKMGNGWVFEHSAATMSSEMTKPNPFNVVDDETGTKKKTDGAYTFRVVPQSLIREDGKVAIKIQTPDENLYYCIDDLSRITPNGSDDAITYWLPNHKYTYTFVISKKGIESITCQVAAWEEVNAKDQDIDLED
ncbi:MAG: fimbrillin family protein [Bacteroidaceae bacterium]